MNRTCGFRNPNTTAAFLLTCPSPYPHNHTGQFPDGSLFVDEIALFDFSGPPVQHPSIILESLASNGVLGKREKTWPNNRSHSCLARTLPN